MSLEKDTAGSLQLDPGVSSRRAKSCWRCLLWTSVGIGACIATFIGGLIAFLVYKGVVFAVEDFRHPHKAMYENRTQDSGASREDVVQPLIGRNQTFDIAVSVWVRGTEDEEEEWRKSKAASELREPGGDGALASGAPADVSGVIQRINQASQQESRAFFYKPLYSDIVFRNARLSDKGVSATINFTIPTERFRGRNLREADLMGTFVIIPSSPSPLDFVVNYSSWMPESVSSNLCPRRSWPFPLGSPHQGDRTIADVAVDSFGALVPLVAFHEIPSRCNTTSGLGDIALDKQPDEGSMTKRLKDEDETAEIGGHATTTIDNPETPSSTPSLAAHKEHPHIITRTHLRIVDETRIFNRKAYNEAHYELKTTSCGQNRLPFIKPSRTSCERSYKKNGNLETRLELDIPDMSTGTDVIRKEWAYVPYLDTYATAAGPRDYVPVPVNREDCSEDTETAGRNKDILALTDKEFMDVTWHLSYSGRTPSKLFLADIVQFSPIAVNLNQSEYQKAMAHDATELWNGLHGHKFHEDAHPRRRIFILALLSILQLVLGALDIGYWYTLRSTVGVSIPGTNMIILGILVNMVIGPFLEKSISEMDSRTGWIFTVLMGASISLPLPLLMAKATTRAEIEWGHGGKSWIPVIRRDRATHRERASERLEAKTSWRVKSTIFLTTLVACYVITKADLHIIPALHPAPSKDEVASVNILVEAALYCGFPLDFAGRILQCILNANSRTFAGSFKVASFLSMMVYILELIQYVPAVVGTFQSREGLGAIKVMQTMLALVIVWQAATLPSVKLIRDDEDDE